MQQFNDNCDAVTTAFKKRWGANVVCAYSVKTNHDKNLIKYAYNELDWNVEVVSEDEYNYACSLGIEKKRIVVNGPHKGKALIDAIISGSVVNLDSLCEIQQIRQHIVNEDDNVADRIRHGIIGLRVNYDLNKDCPNELATDNGYSRFGICYENGDFKKALDLLTTLGISISGIHVHYSTTTRSANVFSVLSSKVANTIMENNLILKYIDMGGCFFGGRIVTGKPTMNEYAEVITANLAKCVDAKKTILILEPGSSVIATTTQYKCKVVSVKDMDGIRIVTLDGTLLHINPFMKERSPKYTVEKKETAEYGKIINEQIICGTTCMENDRFFTIYNERELIEGDEIIFDYAGAYTMSFNSNFIIKIPRVEYIYYKQ